MAAASTYTWIGTNGLTNYWTNSANWVPTGFPDGPGDTANFNVTQSTDFYCYLDQPVTVGHMVMGHLGSAKYGQQIVGSGSIRFHNGGSPATILVCPSNQGSGSQIWVNTVLCDDLQVFSTNLLGALWIGWNMAESNVHSVRFTGNGTATLNLYGANSYSGGTTLVSGILNFNTSPVGPPDNPTNGGFGKGPVTLLGGQFRPHSGSNVVSNFNTLVLAGDVTIPYQTVETNFMIFGTVILSNGTHTLTQNMGMTNVYAGATFAGPIVDAPGESNSLVIAGNGITYLAATNTYAGDTVLRSGKLRLGCGNGMPVGAGKGGLLLAPGTNTNAIFDLNGFSTAVNTISNEGAGRARIDNQSNNTLSILTFGSNNRDSTFSGFISNSVGNLRVEQVGSGTLNLVGAVVHLWNLFEMNGGGGATVNLLGPTVFKPNSIYIGGQAGNSTLNILGNAEIYTGQIFLGQSPGCSGTLNQSNGSVTVTGHLRVGHWPTETSVYNLSGGSLSILGAPTNTPYRAAANNEINGALYIGIDGTGQFNQTGGTATIPALVLDNRGDTPGLDAFQLSGGTLNLGTAYGISGNPSAAFILGDGSLAAPADWTNGSPLQFAITSNHSLTGVHTNQTPIVLSNGALVWGGTLTPGTSFTVTNGALLAGTGTMGGTLTVATGGILAPGSLGISPGVFRGGNATFQSGSVFAVDLDGVGGSQDQLVATGSIACDGALVISNYGNPLTGSVFPILSAPSVSGTFTGLGDGTFFIQQGRVFLIAYSPSNVTLHDEGSNTSLPFIDLLNAAPFAVTNGTFTVRGIASNLIPANGTPQVLVAVGSSTNVPLTNGSPWQFTFDSGSLPEGTNIYVFSAVSSNGSSNQVFYTNIIDHTPPEAPTVSPDTNRFATALTVRLTARDMWGVSFIHYTLDGSAPSASSLSVTNGGEVPLASSCTLSAMAVDLAGNGSAVFRRNYTLAPETDAQGGIRQIYPNPFNPGRENLFVRLVCNRAESIDLLVVDIQGRTLTTLTAVPVPADQLAQITWNGRLADGRNLSRGMYLLLPQVSGVARPELARRLYVP